MLSAEYGWTDDEILDMTFERISLAIKYIFRRKAFENSIKVGIFHTGEPQKLAKTFWDQAFESKKEQKELTKAEAIRLFRSLGIDVKIKRKGGK